MRWPILRSPVAHSLWAAAQVSLTEAASGGGQVRELDETQGVFTWAAAEKAGCQANALNRIFRIPSSAADAAAAQAERTECDDRGTESLKKSSARAEAPRLLNQSPV